MDGATADLQARLDALTARLDEQAARIADLESDNARLMEHGGPAGGVGSPQRPAQATSRRGLLAGAAALVGVGLAKLGAAERAEATHGGANDVIVGATHATSGATTIISNSNTGVPAFAGYSRFIGLDGVGQNHSTGIRGSSNGGGGVDFGGSGNAIEGRSGSGIGVLGQSSSFMGVYGLSASGSGVYGSCPEGSGVRGDSGNGVGVSGRSNNSVGVRGESASVYGVNGVSTYGAGVFGVSNTGFGVYGYSYGTGGSAVGLYGVANSGEGLVGLTQTGIGVHGNAVQSGLAGRFDGKVVVNGTLTVTGGFTTSAIASGDGDFRRTYSQESPEPWIEDFGTATLQNGRAEVALDPELDAVVESTEYLVFLTPKGIECGPLFVSRQREHGFEVRSYAGPLASGTFDYRVVARRRDVTGNRLERIPAANVNLGKDSPPPPTPRTVPEHRLLPEPRLTPHDERKPQP